MLTVFIPQHKHYLLIKNNDLEKVNKNLQAEVDSKNRKTKDLQEAIVSTNDELMKVKQDLKAEITSKNSEIKALRISKVTEIMKVKKELQTEVDSKNSELNGLWENNVLLNNKIEKVKQDLKAEMDSKNSGNDASTNNYWFKARSTKFRWT